MIGVAQWSCFLLLQLNLAFSLIIECGKSNVGSLQLYTGEGQPHSKGIVIVCVGVVEYIEGVYTHVYRPAAFCWGGDSVFNEGAAAAACRQGGYSKQEDFNSASQLGIIPPSGVSYISRIQCPVVNNYSTEGETVLLRCWHTYPYAGDIYDLCPTLELAAVKCNEESITSAESTYNGQIFIGPLESLAEASYPQIKLDGELLPICIDKNNSRNLLVLGRSICQQLGYTNVSTLNISAEKIDDAWYLGSLLCDSVSSSCFTDCFNHSSYFKLGSCDGGNKTGLKVSCIYNESYAGLYGSGGRRLCQIETTYPPSTCHEGAYKLGTIFLFILLGICVISVIFVIIYFVRKRYPRWWNNNCYPCPRNHNYDRM